jgi:hypothetical protein
VNGVSGSWEADAGVLKKRATNPLPAERSGEVARNAGRVLLLPAVVALATVLIAAGIDLEANWNRLKALPSDQRKKIVDNLLRFDAVLNSDQQRAVRELDRRIHELPVAQQSEYFAVLRRYHGWLSRLPDDRRDEILRAAPNERMAAINKLISTPRYKVLSDLTPPFLQVAEIGEYSPFELAAIYKIWHALTPAQRKEVEKPVGNPGRLQVLLRLGDAKKLPREIIPEGYDEERALEGFGPFFKKAHSALVVDLPKKQNEARAAEITRRQAINFYYLSADKRAAVKHVSAERLDQFAATFPWWVQSAFESFPPDEARRRLTIIYRLVFPHPQEIKLVPRETLATPGSRAPARPPTKKAVPAPGRESDFPL